MSQDAELRRRFEGARALVTGAGGFIGRHLTAALLSLGADVTPVGTQTSPSSSNGTATTAKACLPLPVGTDAFRAFLRDAGAFDYVFHLAASTSATGSVNTPQFDFRANLGATVDLLEQLRLQRPIHTRLVFTSSASVYGHPTRLPTREEDPTLPVSPYGVSKLAGEHYVRLYARLYGLSAASVRPFSVYGPYQTKQVVYAFFRDLRASPDRLTVLGAGTQIRDLVYVDDVIRGHLVVAACGRSDGATYNIATSVPTTILQLAHMIVDIQGAPTRVAFSGISRAGDQDSLLGANDAITAIGGAPRWALQDGMRETARWFNHAHQPQLHGLALTSA